MDYVSKQAVAGVPALATDRTSVTHWMWIETVELEVHMDQSLVVCKASLPRGAPWRLLE